MSPRQTARAATRYLLVGLVSAGIASGAVTARAQDASEFQELETKYIFGNFTVGSATGIEGEVAIEPETEADFGKRFGNYAASITAVELEYTPTQYMRIELGPSFSLYSIQNVPGLNNLNMGGVNGFESDFRFVVLDRGPSPLAVTLSVEPEFHSLDETSGANVQNYGLETKIEADAELIKNRLFYAFNLLYEPETTAVPATGSFTESTLGASSALAFQVVPNYVIGLDLWYLRHYDGAAVNSFTGDAVYLGPTFFWQIRPKVLMSASWQMQVAGREVG